MLQQLTHKKWEAFVGTSGEGLLKAWKPPRSSYGCRSIDCVPEKSLSATFAAGAHRWSSAIICWSGDQTASFCWAVVVRVQMFLILSLQFHLALFACRSFLLFPSVFCRGEAPNKPSLKSFLCSATGENTLSSFCLPASYCTVSQQETDFSLEQ